MNDRRTVFKTLRDLGIRLTPQRILILDILRKGNTHMGVEEVYSKARTAFPYIDIATVYRTLNLMKKIDVVTEVAIGERLHFELTHPDRKHNHMVCTCCGKAFNLPPEYLERFGEQIHRDFSFEPDVRNFTIKGKCSLCAEKSEKSGSTYECLSP
jgi:Fe2+ or Zn2+ uptake regulation protein